MNPATHHPEEPVAASRVPGQPGFPAQSRGWWLMAGLLCVTTILLFLPWSNAKTPTVDLRTELIWSAVATVVVGAVGLAFPSRWMAFFAALPTLGAITDLGPVFLPDTGSYAWTVKAVVVVLSAIGCGWIATSMRQPGHDQSTRWVIAPVAAALVVATLWLPWTVVSGIGPESGQKTAISLLFGTAATGAPGVAITRLAIILIMLVGIVGAVLPLISRRTRATRVAMHLALGAAIGLVLLALLLAIRSDSVQASDHSTGIRVALAGFLVIALVWNARLRADLSRAPEVPRWREDTGTIPLITQPMLDSPPPLAIQPIPDGQLPPVPDPHSPNR